MSSVSFRVNDTGVASFIDKLKQKSSELTSEMIRDAQRQTNVAKEQISLVEEKIKALERQTKLETQAAESRIREVAGNRVITSQARIGALEDKNKERFRSGEIDSGEYQARKKKINDLKSDYSEANITAGAEEQIQQLKEQARQTLQLAGFMKEVVSTLRVTSKEEINAVKSGDQTLSDLLEDEKDPQKRLANQLAAQQIQESNKRSEGKRDQPEQWLQFAKALTFERLGGMVQQMPTANNELDFVKPMMAMMGMTSGMLIGTIAEAFTAGQIEYATIGSQFGERMGEVAGTALERTFRARDELTSSNFKLKALGGDNIGKVEAFLSKNGQDTQLAGRGVIENLEQHLERFGLSLNEVSQLQYNIATKQGSVDNLSRTTTQVASLEGGWGVRNETSMMMLELLRSNKVGDKDLQSIVGGILQKGTQSGLFQNGDRSYLNEFLSKNFSQLQKTLLSTQSTVSSGTTFDILSKFNNLGGEWSSKDSRSGGLINNIQSSLSNPGSDSMKALSFYIMKQQHPEMNLADTGIEIQKGMGSPKYLQSMMKYLTSMGGDESYQVYNVANAFGLQNNLAAAKKLVKGYGKLGDKFSIDNLKGTGEYSESSLDILATSQQGITSSTAEIENAYVESAVKGLSVMKDKMTGLFGGMVDELKLWIKDEIRRESGIDSKSTTGAGNSTYKRKGVSVQGSW